MKKLFFTTALLLSIVSYGQVGINTANPQASLHIDGAKDNAAIGAPTAAQQTNDVVVTATGNMGIGNIAPTSKVEITSGVNNTSGLKLTNLTAASPVGVGQTIGVDANGNVVTLANSADVSTVEIGISNADQYTVGDLVWSTIPSSAQTMTVPIGGKAVFINFMLGIDYINIPTGSGRSYYTARLFIDGEETNVFQTTQESSPGGQAQFNFSSVKFLTSGSHTLDVRMKRTYNGDTPSGYSMGCRPLSISFNASYIN